MKAAIDAIVSLLKAAVAIVPYLGASPTGALGPFADIAEERTQCPYTVISHIPGTQNGYQFKSGAYNEPLRIQLSTFDTTKGGASTKAELISNVLDTAGAITLANGEICRRMLRVGAVRAIDAGINERGVRVYQAIQEYKMNVQRKLGISNSILSAADANDGGVAVALSVSINATAFDITKFLIGGLPCIALDTSGSASIIEVTPDLSITRPFTGRSWQALAGVAPGVAASSGTIT